MACNGWVGIDMDGTLVTYDKVFEPTQFGEPIMEMVERVRRWLAEGLEVRIFTARAARTKLNDKEIEGQISFSAAYGEPLTREQAIERIKYWNGQTDASIAAIKAWCVKYFGQELEVTCEKDFRMLALYDDRAFHVVFNKGIVCCGHENVH